MTAPTPRSLRRCLLLTAGLVAGNHALAYDVTLSPNGQNQATAIQNAINTVASNGGGKVILSGGTFRSGSVNLKSKVELRLVNATWLASTNWRDYNGGTFDWNKGLINCTNINNFKITASNGTIDGQWCWGPSGQGEEGSNGHIRGPHLIAMKNCSDMVVNGITLQNAGNYGIFAQDTWRLNVNYTSIYNGYDGVHTRYCHNVTVDHVTLETGDDAIAGWVNENFVVQYSDLNSPFNALRIGCKNLEVKNCNFWGWTAPSQRYGASDWVLMEKCFMHLSPNDPGTTYRAPGWGSYDSVNWNIHDNYCDDVQGFFWHYVTIGWDQKLPMGNDSSGRGVTMTNNTIDKQWNGMIIIGKDGTRNLSVKLVNHRSNTFQSDDYSTFLWDAYALQVEHEKSVETTGCTFTNSTGIGLPAVYTENVTTVR